MATNAPLRKTLRKIPTFRSMASRELDAISNRIVYKEYQPDDVLWRTRSRLDFLGIVQEGEIVVERRINGSLIRSAMFRTGDYICPDCSKARDNRSVFLARAVTNVRLATLPVQELDAFLRKCSISGSNIYPVHHTTRRMSWRWWWNVAVVALTILLVWHDATRVLSGLIYLTSVYEIQSGADYQKSLDLLTYAKTLEQGASFVYAQEGYIRTRQNDLQQAETAFMRALEIDQFNKPSLNNLAVTYFSAGRIQDALALQQTAVQHDPDSAAVHYNLGVIFLENNDPTEALREFREAGFIDPDWVLPYIQQGIVNLQLQNYVEAEKAGWEAVRLDSDQPSAHLILAIALYNLGEYQDALGFAEQTLSMVPDDVARFYKALILIKLGETDTALFILYELRESSSDAQQVLRINAEIENIDQPLLNSFLEMP